MGPWTLPLADDLSRDVYCVLGIPIDAIDMPAALRRIEAAADSAVPFFISTPNLNFLVNSQVDPEFRESLMLSDLCPADGMPIVWIARLLGLPIRERVPGSGMFEALKTSRDRKRSLKIYFFGATENVTAAAAGALNSGPSTLRCAGWSCPGFGTVEDMSTDRYIDAINASDADFLVTALSAQKGQLWLLRNHKRLRVPIRAHLGAVVHFQAGTLKRAPRRLQNLGLEWLWRISQERRLLQRYWHDGGVFLRLLITRVLPLALAERWSRRKDQNLGHNLIIEEVHQSNAVTVSFVGRAVASEINTAVEGCRSALKAKNSIVIDWSRTTALDARFLGLVLMLRKQLKADGLGLEMVSMSPAVKRGFRLNGLGWLLPATTAS